MTDKGNFQGTTNSGEFMTMEMLRKVTLLDYKSAPGSLPKLFMSESDCRTDTQAV